MNSTAVKHTGPRCEDLSHAWAALKSIPTVLQPTTAKWVTVNSLRVGTVPTNEKSRATLIVERLPPIKDIIKTGATLDGSMPLDAFALFVEPAIKNIRWRRDGTR